MRRKAVNANWTAWGVAALLAGAGTGLHTQAAPGAVQSQSGQFFVYAPRSTVRSPVASMLATNKAFLELDPALLVVSCERIRQRVTQAFELPGAWQGRIHISLTSCSSAADPITIAAEQFRGEWSYRMQLPDVVERRRLTRALLEVLLVEMANRNNPGKSAELPPWLAVGLTEHLLATAENELLFPPPRAKAGGLPVSRVVVTERRRDPLAEARTNLTQRAALMFQELSWPAEQDFTGDTAGVYRASAHLFVVELLRLNDGPACFRALLQELPRHLNWQTAFFRAFRSHFARPLDAEKWWALQAAFFTGRDPANRWDDTESWHKLNEAIQVPAQVRASKRELPAAETIRLQTVVSQWEITRQTAVLRERIRQLELVRQRVATDLAGLAESYRALLANYLERRDKIGTVPGRRHLARGDFERLIEETVRGLNRLDQQLEAIQPDTASNSGGRTPPATTAAK